MSLPVLPSPSAQSSDLKWDIEKHLVLWAKAFARSIRGGHFGQISRFSREQSFRLREGRLIALSYPERTERSAVGIAEDPTQPAGDRFYMMLLLGYLAQSGRSESTNALFRLANAPDPVTSDRAIFALWPSDMDGRFKDLYLQKSAMGYVDVFKPLSLYADPTTLAHVNKLLALPEEATPESFSTRFCSRETLHKYEILLSPTVEAQLTELILRGESEDADWALQVSLRRPFPNLPQLLRQSLDLALQRSKEAYTRVDYGPSLPGEVRPTFDELYRTRAESGGAHSCYDDVLLSLLNLKPQLLTDSDRARLRTFGYGCDPKERLNELFSSDH